MEAIGAFQTIPIVEVAEKEREREASDEYRREQGETGAGNKRDCSECEEKKTTMRDCL